VAAKETDNDHGIDLAVGIAKVIGTPKLVLIRADVLQEVSHLSNNTLSHKRRSRAVRLAVVIEKTQGAGKEDLLEADETYSLIQD
jgi:hypothetical protein